MDAIGPGSAAGILRHAAGRRRAAAMGPCAAARRWSPSLRCSAAAFSGSSIGSESSESLPARNADGIVALTGGPFRINDALDLLAAGRGQRLLITGVNPVTRPGEISRLVPEHQRWFTCCVDIDHSAQHHRQRRRDPALGEGPRLPVADRGHRELSTCRARWPSSPTSFRTWRWCPIRWFRTRCGSKSWWENPETARLLFLEYLKYIVAKVRMWLPWSFE